MYIVSVKQEVPIEFGVARRIVDSEQNSRVEERMIKILKPGHRYVMAEDYYNKLQIRFGMAAFHSFDRFEAVVIDGEGNKIPKYYHRYNGECLDGKSLIVWRSGGIGDLLFLTPCFQYLKETYPTCKITLACANAFADMFYNHPYIDKVLYLPLDYDAEIMKHDYALHMQGIIEGHPAAQVINCYELHAVAFSLAKLREVTVPDPDNPTQLRRTYEIYDCKISRDKMIPSIVPNLEFEPSVNAMFSEWGIDRERDIIIAFHPRSSAILRSYHGDKAAKVCDMLTKLKKNIKIIFIGGLGEQFYIDALIENHNLVRVYNYAKYAVYAGMTINLINKCDFVVGCDSGILHIAGALKKPMLGIYGPFDCDLRLSTYKNASAIMSKTMCSPCFRHTHIPCQKRTGGDSPCFDVILPQYVATEVMNLINKFKIKEAIQKNA